ncbi:MAG: hypothetical protein EOP00_00885 [Pedobacter sp.]|nr:MAG: hypothetical protein EOP00_00885 [Pedobacter sp.]
MTKETIQTLHPVKDKTNKIIDLEKYIFIRDSLLEILAENEPTHTEMMEMLFEKVKDIFEGGIWYGETVKLDLEARELIERFGKSPERYRLIAVS